MTTTRLEPPPTAPTGPPTGILVAGLMGLALMVLFAHGCHNHDEDLEPSAMVLQVDDPNG
ncbi:MAG: hypothetical protein LC104_07100 [Bacteroidales bacterium]|nr:hypothetical protein [Bacteroidales bacterium]